MDRAALLLDGARELLDATLVLAVSWASDTVATVHLASPRSYGVPAISLSRHLTDCADGMYVEAPLTSGWFHALTRPSTGLSDRQHAVLVVGTIARDGNDAQHDGPAGALIAVWDDEQRMPALARTRSAALRVLLDTVVRTAQSVEAEAKSSVRLSTMLDTVPQGIVLTDEVAHTALVNAAAAELLELPVGEVSAAALADAMRLLRARCADPQQLSEEGQVLFASADGSRRDWLWHVVHPTVRYLRVTTLPVRATSHRGRVWTFEDATRQTLQQQQLALALSEAERERAQLATSEERFRLAASATRDIMWDWDVVADVCTWTAALDTTLGLGADALRTVAQWSARVHPDDRLGAEAALQHVFDSGETRFSAEYRLRRADDSYAYVRNSGTLIRDADGQPIRMIGAMHDESARTALEGQLRHSQKMEGIGRLAGGVAHDFNNLLSVILTSLEFVVDALPAQSDLVADVAEAQRAAERAAVLTRQLLAFGRKQVLQPRIVDLRELVVATESLLRRALGEDVRLRVDCTASESRVYADRGQLEQVLLNLVVNARDAMPHGGELCIQLLNAGDSVPPPSSVPPAARELLARPHVLLAVQDTGTGMSPLTAAQAFEPYFTTKDQGKGTGLGLSIVHGIVTQSGGAIWIDSSADVGLTVWVALPRASEGIADEQRSPARATAVSPQLILLVEDEDGVRTLTERLLRREGHAVVSASNGVEGLRVWREHGGGGGTISAVITDVVMPQMGGREFMRAVRADRPHIPVLFISGYAEGELSEAELEGRTAFLQKPFTADALRRQLAAVSRLE